MSTVYAQVTAGVSLAPATHTSTTNGSSVDLDVNQNGFRSAMIVVVTGSVTAGTHTISVQHSNDNTNWDPAAAADLEGSPPAIGTDDSNKTYEVGYRGSRRYVRAVSTVTGTTPSGTYGAFVLMGSGKVTPLIRS